MSGWVVGVFNRHSSFHLIPPASCRFAAVFILTGPSFPAGDVIPFRLRSALCIGDFLVGLMPKRRDLISKGGGERGARK